MMGEERDAPLLSFIERTIGPVDVDSKIALSIKARVYAYQARCRANPAYQAFFTAGLFRHTKNAELIMLLPTEFPLRDYVLGSRMEQRIRQKGLKKIHYPETLPIDIFNTITAACTRKNSTFGIREGTFIDRKHGKTWGVMAWPEECCGFTFLDSQWDMSEQWQPKRKDDNAENQITFYTVVPVTNVDYHKLDAGWYEARRNFFSPGTGWPLFGDMQLADEMCAAIHQKDWAVAEALLEQGVNPNRGMCSRHPIWGVTLDEPYLLTAIWTEGGFPFVKTLVAFGAEILPESATLAAQMKSVEQFDYFVSMGCSVNAPDNVGYFALDRAVCRIEDEIKPKLTGAESEEEIGEILAAGIQKDEIARRIIAAQGQYHIKWGDAKSLIRALTSWNVTLLPEEA